MSEYLSEVKENWSITFDNLNAAVLSGNIDAIEKWTAVINHIENIYKEYLLKTEL